jgi:hypothetical protein
MRKHTGKYTRAFAEEFDTPFKVRELKFLIREIKEDAGLTKNKEIKGEIADKLMDWAEDMKDEECFNNNIFMEIVEDELYNVDWDWVASYLLEKYNKKGR